MVLGYLISPVVQIVDSHGKPIVGAKIYVYKAGTTDTVNTYRDFSNHYNPTPVLTDTLGNCTIIAPDDMIYDIVVKDNRNNLLMSKDNLTVSSGINPDINLRFNEGYGIIIRKNDNIVTIAVDTDVIATKDDLADKQDKLTAGDNIEITDDNTINVVDRKTLYTQWPLKIDRTDSTVKIYLDSDYANEFKSKQEAVEFGGENGQYISYITQNINGDIDASVRTLPSIPSYTAGDGISIEGSEISIDNTVALKSDISIQSQDFIVLNEDHALTSSEATNKSFSITIPGNIDYWTWANENMIAGRPIVTIYVGTYGGAGIGEVIYSNITNIYDGNAANTFAQNQQTMYSFGIEYVRTWPTSKPSNLDHQKLEIRWTGNTLSEGDTFTYSVIVQASKLVVS